MPDRKDFFLALTSGVLLTLAFPRFSWYPLAWVSLVPLLYAQENRSIQLAFILGWITGVVHFVSLLYWITYVIHHYGKVPMVLGAGTLLLLTGYLALFPALAIVLYRFFRRRWMFPESLAIAVSWVSTEFARGHLLTGFPWDFLGYSQIPCLRLVQSADLFGILGISFLVAMCNGVVMGIVSGKRRKTVFLEILIFLSLFGTNLLYGTARIREIKSLSANSPKECLAIIQGDISQELKWNRRFQEATLEIYGRLTRQAIKEKKPLAVIWPETAAPFYFGYDAGLSRKLLDIARNNKIFLVTGVPGLKYNDSRPLFLNQAIALSSHGKVVGVYSKEHLVPFGEYVPLKKLLFFVHKIAEGVGDFAAGSPDQPLMKMGDRSLGVLICYEVIFPDLSLKRVNQGADILVNLSNDAWFGNTSAPYQHLEMARARAIETRRPLIRCTNTGISAFITPVGEIKSFLPLNQRGYLIGNISLIHTRSVYSGIKDMFAWLTVFCSVLVIILQFCDKIRKQSRH